MNAPPVRIKPKAVLKAEYALITWTAWTCIYGIYDAWTTLPQVTDALKTQMPGQLPDMLNVSPQTMMQWTIGYYALVALVSFLFIIMIGKGKRWARSSFLWGFLLEVLCSGTWMALAVFSGSPPSFLDWAAYVPDLGLQIYALWMLYTWPGERWFKPPPLADSR